MSKYSLAKVTIDQLNQAANADGIGCTEAQEALLVSLVQTLKEEGGAPFVRGVLEYEIDSLGSGGEFEIQRGGGHS
ncbi:MAG: hypothetical protein GKR90_16280 [Pseudomonadales bacterium]|nr:hypothetical protein [Pseudomonadales bacterium]